jgi:diguanylate cyclase (GGDEF)-like protein
MGRESAAMAKRILLLGEPLDNAYGKAFYSGARRACKRLGHDLLMLCGGMQADHSGAMPGKARFDESRSNTLFNMVDPGLADGVLLWGAQLCHHATEEALRRQISRFGERPVVSLGPPLEGAHSLMADNRSGTEALVRHLVDEHGIRDIAYFVSDSGLPLAEAEERYRGYRDGLESRGIAFRPELVVTGQDIDAVTERAGFQEAFDYRTWGVVAFEYLTSGRGLRAGRDFRAVMVRDDRDALKVMGHALKMGLRVPEDLAICGYDDIEAAAHAPSPLTTVRQDFSLQAEKAVELLDSLMRGEPATGHQSMDINRPVVRESCGCPNRYARRFSEGGLCPQGDGSSPRDIAMKSVRDCVESGSDPLESLAMSVLRSKRCMEDGDEDSAIAWMGAIPEAADYIVRAQRHRFHQSAMGDLRLANLHRNILSSYRLANVFASLAETLPGLGMPSCRIVVFEDGEKPLEGQGRLIYAYPEGFMARSPASGSRPVSPGLLACGPGMLSEFPPGFHIATLLHFAGQRIGYALFGVGDADPGLPAAVSSSVQMALSGSFLFSSLDQKRAELEKAYAEIVELSNRDPLTGLPNRRAMQNELAKEKRRLDRYRGMGAPSFSLLFIDLDNFKYYNDSFGHEAGDLALKHFSALVTSLIRMTDIASRFGGDEFLIILPQTDSAGAAILAGRILESLASKRGFEEELSRGLGARLRIPPEWRLGCSIGIAAYSPDEDIDRILREADAALYRAKAEGKNRYKLSDGGGR